MGSPELLELSQRDRETLEAWLVEFDQGWQEAALSTWAVERLPNRENPLRRLALAEMVKVDLERQWQCDHRLLLESYLDRFPELGDADSVSVDLILAEYEARQESGAPVEFSEFARRFPRQAAELAGLMENTRTARSYLPLSFEQPLAAIERDTSHPGSFSDTVPPQTHAPKELPETFGRYRIFKKLGQGGMGAVYQAFDTQLERQVALKVPYFAVDEGGEVVERFLREARAAAKIEHPNLCAVHDVGEIDGIHYMTMAYIEGRLLSELIQPGKPMPMRNVVTLVRKLALALHEAHACGIVHRDLKPTNIIINQRDEPIIMDFGLARRTESEETALTHAGAVLGTPAYMSPEQAKGQSEAIGPRSDIYSLGVILYELLTSRRPFRGQVVEVLAQVVTAEPEPPSTHRPGLDPRLESICLRAMAKRPEDRHDTMAQLAEALGECLQSTEEPHTPSTPVQSGSLDSAETLDRPASAISRSSAVEEVSRSGDRAQQETPGEETYGLSEALQGLTGLLLDVESSPSALGQDVDADSDRRESQNPAGAADRQVSGASERPPVGSVVRSGDRPQRKTPPLRHVPRWLWIPTAFAAAAVLLGVILYVSTDYGFVKIELSHPAAQVHLKLDRTIDITGIDRPLRVRAGQHRIVVTGDDFEAKVESFVVRRGKEELVSIALVPKAAMHPAEVKSPDSTMTKRPAGPTLPLAENPADGVVTPQKPVVPSPAPDNSPNDPESELNYKRFIRDTYKLFPPGSLKPAAGITPQVEAAAKKAIIGAWECDTEVMVPYLMKKRNIGRQDAELAAKLVSFFRADITGNTIFLQSNPKENGKGEYKVVDKAEDSVTIEITKSIEHIAVGEKWTFVIEKGSLGIRLDDMVICMRRKE